MTTHSAHVSCLAFGLALCFGPIPAGAFTFQSVVQDGCHERITAHAIEQAGWPAGEPEATSDDLVLAENATFQTPAHASRWTLSMLVGVRDNDLHGNAPADLAELSGIHNGAQTQDEHCLRALADEGDTGDAHALSSCRDYILNELATALGEGEVPDLSAVEPTMVSLRYQRTQVPLTRYAFHLGRACHALQDSFAHSFRGDSGRSVVSVLNYIAPVLLPGYQPARDGHRHLAAMDGCDEADPASADRVRAATDASAALMSAVGAPGGRADRLRRAAEVLDQWMSYAPGCTEDNGWCGNDQTVATGCSSTGSAPQLALLFLGLLAMARAGLRRRGVRSGARRAWPVVALAGLGLAGPALAQHVSDAEAAPSLTPTEVREVPLAVVAAPIESPPAADAPSRLGLHGALGVSVDRGSLNVTIGSQFALTRRLSLGLDVEYSPWFDVMSASAAAGTLNAYASASFAWLIEGRVQVRSAIGLGACGLLFDTPGARAGSIGPFLSASPVRLDVRLSPAVELEFSPDIVLAAPSLRGVPFVYHQYRATVGVRWTF